jgi:hypothetical protein
MAVFSDGTTDLTYSSDETYQLPVEKTTKRAGGGNLKSITSGERLSIGVRLRLTPAQYRSLLNLFSNNADNYYYTPEESEKSWMSDLWPNVTWPINVNYSSISNEWNNRGYWYVVLGIDSTSYIV